MYRRVVGVVALLIAVVVVANPLYLSFWHDQYYHSTEEVTADSVPEEADVLAYQNFSADGKTAFRKAVEDDEGHYVVYYESNVPEEFFYSDYSNLGKGLYYVQYQGNYYRFSTYAGGGFPFTYWFYEGLLALFGLTLAVVGHRTYEHRESSWPAVALSLLAVGLLVGSPLFRFPFGESLWMDAVMIAPLVGGVVVFLPKLRQLGDADET